MTFTDPSLSLLTLISSTGYNLTLQKTQPKKDKQKTQKRKKQIQIPKKFNNKATTTQRYTTTTAMQHDHTTINTTPQHCYNQDKPLTTTHHIANHQHFSALPMTHHIHPQLCPHAISTTPHLHIHPPHSHMPAEPTVPSCLSCTLHYSKTSTPPCAIAKSPLQSPSRAKSPMPTTTPSRAHNASLSALSMKKSQFGSGFTCQIQTIIMPTSNFKSGMTFKMRTLCLTIPKCVTSSSTCGSKSVAATKIIRHSDFGAPSSKIITTYPSPT